MADDDWIEVIPSLRIPRSELVLRATRSGGPGGQHVNTSSTRIELTWDVAGSLSLPDETRAWLLKRLAARLDTSGQLRLVAQEERSQLRNRETVLDPLPGSRCPGDGHPQDPEGDQAEPGGETSPPG